MSAVTLKSQAIKLPEKMTLGLVIETGEVSEQENLSVQINDTVLNKCTVISHDGAMVVALLPRRDAEDCISPEEPSSVSIPAFGITDVDIDWTRFPFLVAEGHNDQIRSAESSEGEAKPFATLDAEQPSSSETDSSPDSFSPPDAFAPPDADTEQKDADTEQKKEPAATKATSSGKKKIILIGSGAGLAVILLAGAGSWFWLHKGSQFMTPAYENMAPEDAVKQLNTPAAIGREGWRRIKAGQGDAGLRLLGYAALKHDPEALQRMGELYDPASFKAGGPVPQANPQEAARYYHEAVQAGNHNVRTEQSRLLEDLRKKADNGDQNAAFTLQEFAR